MTDPIRLTGEEQAALRDAATLSPAEYDRTRVALAQKLGIRVKALDAEVEALRASKNGNKPTGTSPLFEDPEPWPEPVDGADLLDELAAWLRAFVVTPGEAIDAATLWTAYTWCVGIATYAPLLVITAPTMQSGKTVLLSRVGLVVRRPYLTSGVGATPAVIFRLNETSAPTFIIDEAEKLRGDGENKDIIGLLNAGYERGGKVSRCEKGPDGSFQVVMFDAFGCRACAAIGILADTLMDRAIVIPLQRKKRSAKVRRATGRVVKAEADLLARKFARWTDDNMDRIEAAEAEAPRPDWLDDRACDKWAGLFALAAVAGGDWPERALEAARAVSSDLPVDDGAGVALLRFMARLFREKGTDRLETAEIVQVAATDDEAPTGYKGRELDARAVARLLKPFGITSKSVRLPDGRTPKGYRLEDCRDVFDAYLDPVSLLQGGPDPQHPPQWLNHATNGPFMEAPQGGSVADRKEALNPCKIRDVADVADKYPPIGRKHINGDLWNEGGRDTLDDEEEPGRELATG